ncbi:hypothetical protein ACLBNB_20115 [Pseudomonas chlororaphis subsp. aurantiaca]|uniref:hypothetical protein n=1 Tax=Pseudomonas chlororaphis TaxID=587753 RepID=UPI00398AAC42
MTYVRDQSPAELAAHMRTLQSLPGWHDPLADRLWQEVERLKANNEALLDGMTKIMHATHLGDQAFAIACEVVGELGHPAKTSNA